MTHGAHPQLTVMATQIPCHANSERKLSQGALRCDQARWFRVTFDPVSGASGSWRTHKGEGARSTACAKRARFWRAEREV